MSDGWRELTRGVVHPWHHDQFGHMNVRWYAHFFDDAVFHLWSEFGIGLQTLERDFGVHSVTARATTDFVKELAAGDLVRIDGGVARLGTNTRFHVLGHQTLELHTVQHTVITGRLCQQSERLSTESVRIVGVGRGS